MAVVPGRQVCFFAVKKSFCSVIAGVKNPAGKNCFLHSQHKQAARLPDKQQIPDHIKPAQNTVKQGQQHRLMETPGDNHGQAASKADAGFHYCRRTPAHNPASLFSIYCTKV